jgi:uncharacterized protein
MLEFWQQPLPWYVAGPLIGLTVPLLMLLGGKSFGVSSNLRHLCAIMLPERFKPTFLQYNWSLERWNIAFVLGLLIGGFIAGVLFANPQPIAISDAARASMNAMGIPVEAGLLPQFFFAPNLKTLALLALGGFLIGFGTRYADGCTSGHAITGLSSLQWPSLIATISFFAAGIVSANWVLPWLLK